ncbi:hypothetical protein HDV00_001415 [Rhizophlyctis rosea]|nr:hypothetical protein HDV00_001415 [Rhizophlyctis rosea]
MPVHNGAFSQGNWSLPTPMAVDAYVIEQPAPADVPMQLPAENAYAPPPDPYEAKLNCLMHRERKDRCEICINRELKDHKEYIRITERDIKLTKQRQKRTGRLSNYQKEELERWQKELVQYEERMCYFKGLLADKRRSKHKEKHGAQSGWIDFCASFSNLRMRASVGPMEISAKES